MSLSRRSLICCMFLFTVVLALVLAVSGPIARAETLTVTNTNDSGAGSLRQAIVDAASGDTITFADDYTITLTSQLTISKSLTIDGAGHAVIVSGDQAVRVFYVDPGVIFNLKNLSVTQGQAADHGGGIYNAGALNVTHCTFSGNRASTDGGSLYNVDQLTVLNSTFSGNSATSGGGIFNEGTLTVTNSAFLSNTATSLGGGLCNQDSVSTLESVTFSGNTASSGGGLYNTTSGLTLTYLTFFSNTATNGGGIYNDASSPVLTNVTFSHNIAEFGGGMHNQWNSNPVLTNVTFFSNTATAVGGGMSNWISSRPTLLNVTFFSNMASIRGGGLYNFSDSNPQVINSILWGDNGGEVVNDVMTSSATAVLTNSVVQGGCPSNSTCANIILADPQLGPLGDYGGGLPTIPLLPGSSALGATDTACPDTDERGVARSTTCDLGAYESRGFALTKVGGDNQSALINTAFKNPIVVSVTSAYSEPVNGGLITLAGPLFGASTNPITTTAVIANGTAMCSVAANDVTGAYSVTASATGALSATFTLTNTTRLYLPLLVKNYGSASRVVSYEVDLIVAHHR